MKNRIIAFILSVTLLISVFPLRIFAEGTDNIVAKSSDSNDNGLELSKTVIDNTDGTYTLRLESYATGNEETITTVTKIPSDIVLVLDESGSMDNCFICGANPATEGKINYSKIYASDMDPSKASDYYYKVEDTYYRATYCNKEGCESYGQWLQNNNDHKDNGAHSKGAARPPKENADQSNNYQYYTIDHVCSQRVTALKSAVNNFMQSVYSDAAGTDGTFGTGDDVKHRIAIVSFAGSDDEDITNDVRLESYIPGSDSVTGAIGSGELGFDYSSNLDLARYQRLFRNVVIDTERNRLDKIVSNKIGTGGETYTELGLHAAMGVLGKSPIPLQTDINGRNRTVIMFTDGAPTHGSKYFYEADTAVEYANEIKNTYKATLFTVGIFSGADASNPTSLPQYLDPKTHKLNPDNSDDPTIAANGIAMANRFMHLVSSNYPNATGMAPEKTGTINSNLDGDNYYLSAGDTDELIQVFQRIYDSITEGGTTVTLDETTVLKDIVEDSFYIPDESDSVKAYSMTYGGTDSDGEDIWTKDALQYETTIDVEKNTVTVSGFDYADNYVGMNKSTSSEGDITHTPHGKKLVLDIVIKPKPDFLGGDNVVTNKNTSAIYDSTGMLVEAFPIPDVDIDVSTIAPLCISKDIYLSQQASLPDVIKLGEYNQNRNAWKVDGINNEYVNIVYTITDPAGNTIDYTIPAGTNYDALTDHGWSDDAEIAPLLKADTTYTVTCTVTSKSNADNTKTGTANPTVNVYKPEIRFYDSAIELGNKADYETENVGTVTWKHGDTVADTGTMGVAPTLEYAYDPVEDVFKEDTPVKVTVTAKGNGQSVPLDQNITEYVTFKREACTYKDCDHKTETTVNATDDNRINFVVHIKSFDLTINKNVVSNVTDENQSFIFRVTGPDNFSMDVTIVGSGSITLTDLPVGTYTIEELDDWSWRYESKDGSQQVTPENVDDGQANVSFTNTRNENKWLSGDSYCENWWGNLTNNN